MDELPVIEAHSGTERGRELAMGFLRVYNPLDGFKMVIPVNC
jgi:hypothetical protein